jgi:hypothetical protein
LFARDSIWKAPVPSGAPLDPNSASIVQNLVQQAATESLDLGLNGPPFYVVPANAAKVRVTLDEFNPVLQRVFDAVPMPPSAQPGKGTDHPLAVYQPSTDTMWEFWKLSREPDGWHAHWGGRMIHVSKDPGYYRHVVDAKGNVLEQASWGTTAASFPLMGGVMTTAELRAGHIDHALSLAISHTRAGVFAAPAQRTDGDSLDPNAPPEGAHFRLDPTLNLASLRLPPFVLMMAQAAQRYGIYIDNRSDGFTFRCQDPRQFEARYGYNPYLGRDDRPGSPGALLSAWPGELLRMFPWSHLQLLDMSLRTRPDRTPFTEPAPKL